MAFDRISVEGRRVLSGEICLQGSKNAALPMLAASVINNGITRLDNCPDISDVNDMIQLLRSIGCVIVRDGKTVIVDSREIGCCEIPRELAGRTRGSFIMLGALLARCGNVKIPYPGGCRIGTRPVDIHLNALCKMGMQIVSDSADELSAVFKKKSAHLRFYYPSVGATENVILASVLGEGCVVLNNAAREPEIAALCGLLTAMGACIKGAGTSKVIICGVDALHDAQYVIPGDRIVAGTYMTAAMITHGSIAVRGVNAKEISKELEIFGRAGASITMWDDVIHIRNSKNRIMPVRKIVTKPYPGFPTDMQSQLMSMLIYADGKSSIVENVFENRFMTVGELLKLGADINIKNNTAYIAPVGHLYASGDLCAMDLRGGAALILAALGAIGKSYISGYRHVERGYEEFVENLSMLGAAIKVET